ncbi:MAG: ABC transporter ATP-binding protein [Frisingicoccus sp.]
MKPGNAIEVKNVKKKFKVYFDKGSQLKERILFRNRNRYEERWVLDDVSFEVKQGEAIGLIGHNGCGKSTTLKLLTRIMYPDSGSIELKGRVSSLIELGAGFHPDMSGRENIYTNASIFGLTKRKLMNVWTTSLSSLRWNRFWTIRCVLIRQECICVWPFLLLSM